MKKILTNCSVQQYMNVQIAYLLGSSYVLNIKSIHKQFGTIPMKTFPHYSFIKQYFIDKKLEYVHLLNYTDYNKSAVKELIIKEMGWKDYGGKHYESIFTRFYQGYILKEKFKIDKRQFHLSALVQANQITRDEALIEYNQPAYNQKQCEEDKEYVMKKLGFSSEEFQNYMNAKIHKHEEYPSISKYWNMYFSIIKVLKPIKILFKK